MIRSSFSPYRLIFGNLSVGSSLRPIHYRTSRNYYSQNNFIPSIPPRFLVRILVSSRIETGSGRGSERARARREKRKRRNLERGESARTPTRRNPSPVALHKGYPLNLSVRYAPLRFSGFAENRALETEAAARTGDKGMFVGSFASRGAPSTRGIRAVRIRATAHCPPKMDSGPTWEIEHLSLSVSPHSIRNSFRIPFEVDTTIHLFHFITKNSFIYSFICLTRIIYNHVRSACCSATSLLQVLSIQRPLSWKSRARAVIARLCAAGCRLPWAYARSFALAAFIARTRPRFSSNVSKNVARPSTYFSSWIRWIGMLLSVFRSWRRRPKSIVFITFVE